MSLTQLLQTYEPQFLDSISLDDLSHLEHSLAQFAAIMELFKMEKANGSVTQECGNLVNRLASRVKVVAAAMLDIEQASAKLHDATDSRCESFFNSQGSAAFSSSSTTSTRTSKPPSTPDTSSQETLPTRYLRAWLLDNLADPFPSRSDKEDLVDRTNLEEGGKNTLIYNQVVLWFTNARRRSGWTSFYRRFAASQKSRMIEILQILHDHFTSNPPALNPPISALSLFFIDWNLETSQTKAEKLAKECTEQFEGMLDWIHEKHSLRIGEWMEGVEVLADETREKERKERKRRGRMVKECEGMGERRTPSTRSSNVGNRNHSNSTASNRSISNQSNSSLFSESNRTYFTGSSNYSTYPQTGEREDSLTPPPPISNSTSTLNRISGTENGVSRNIEQNFGFRQPIVPSQMPITAPSPSAFIYSNTGRGYFSGNILKIRDQRRISLTPISKNGQTPIFGTSLGLPNLGQPNFSTSNHFEIGNGNGNVNGVNYSSSPGSDGGYSLGALNSLQNSPEEVAGSPINNDNSTDLSVNVLGKRRRVDGMVMEVEGLGEREEGRREVEREGGSNKKLKTQQDFNFLNSNGGSHQQQPLPERWVPWNGQ